MPGARAQNARGLGRTNRAIPNEATAALAALQTALQRIPTADDVRLKVQAEARARAAASEQRRVQEERLQDEDVAVAYSESLSPEGGTFAEYSPAWVRNPAFRRHADPVVERRRGRRRDVSHLHQCQAAGAHGGEQDATAGSATGQGRYSATG